MQGLARIGVLGAGLVLAFGGTASAAEVAADSFSRTATNGWGTADLGGTWATEGSASAFAVDGSAATIRIATTGANLVAMLPPQLLETDVAATVSLDKSPAGSNVWLYHDVRRVGTTSYRLKARFAANGNTYIRASRVVSGTETDLGTEVQIPGITHLGGLRLRAQATGTNPTTLRIRAWAPGSTEPTTWHYTTTDATTALQRPGAAGLRTYSSRSVTNPPITLRIDDYTASDLDDTPPPPPPPPGDPVLVGAGDIATADTTADSATANLLDGIAGTVFTLGDNVYPNGTAAEFAAYYEPTWGRHRARTKPVAGNHDYNTAGATGYYGYFGAAAGDPTKGYYSYDLGAWHVVVLNSNCNFVSCSTGSAQEQWLRADLAASTAQCTVAMFHHPRFSSGSHGSNSSVAPFWNALDDFDADLILAGHEHSYERFAPQSRTGAADPDGIRQIIVGTGGTTLRGFSTIRANSEARNSTAHGVLKLTLHASSYDWEFVPVAGASFTDTGTGSCH